jgi:glycerol kinase
MAKDSGRPLAELAVDGGMTNSDLCMQVCLPIPLSLHFPSYSISSNSFEVHSAHNPQTQADLTGIPVERPRMLETTALGAAIAAGFAIGVWQSFDELKNVNTAGVKTFTPKIGKEEREKRFARWEKAVNMCRGWAE